MVKVKVLNNFHLDKFKKLKNIERADVSKNSEGYLYTGDTFECTEDMAEYLMNTEGHRNPANKIFVSRVPLEVIPKDMTVVKDEQVEEEKPKRIRRRRSVAKK